VRLALSLSRERLLEMSTADERIVHNNHVFREANERIRSASDQYGDPVESIPFLCECPSEDCVTIVRMTADDYSAIRKRDDHFFTAPGHEEREAPVGEVVTRRDGYVIVEKKAEES
jgi:hypothetical protein